jgi:hypothetical protein
MERSWKVASKFEHYTVITVASGAQVAEVATKERTAAIYTAAQLDTLIADLAEARRAIS